MARYELGSLIGSGGFGEVLEGKRLEDGLIFAIKKLHKQHNSSDAARFRREVRLQETLNHKNIVPIIESHLDDAQPWFVMPMALYSLRQIIEDFEQLLIEIFKY